MAKMVAVTKMVAGKEKLTIRVAESANGGFNVSASHTPLEGKTAVGLRSNHTDLQEALGMASKHVEEATSAGWVIKPPFVRPPKKEKPPKKQGMLVIPLPSNLG